MLQIQKLLAFATKLLKIAKKTYQNSAHKHNTINKIHNSKMQLSFLQYSQYGTY